MGSRAQVQVKSSYQRDADVFLYTHWGSGDLPEVVASALDRGRGRWGDSEYLTRIIFSEMIKDDVMDETGFGIGTSAHGDLDYPPIVVNDNDKTVTHEGRTRSYDDFIAAYRTSVGAR